MRRKDREITAPEEIRAIIETGDGEKQLTENILTV